VDTAFERGWSALNNGELLDAAEHEGYDLLITKDQNLRYQQPLADRQLAILVLLSIGGTAPADERGGLGISEVATDFLEDILRQAGELLLAKQSERPGVEFKIRHSHLVTEVDRTADALLVSAITTAYPRGGIVSEESGFRASASGRTWVIDPLDGTANFAAGLPDFGVIIGMLQQAQPIVGGMSLPACDELYLAEHGSGATRNGACLAVTEATELREVLIDQSFHFRDVPDRMARELRIFRAVWPRVRGVRSSGCLRYLAQLAEGQLGAFIAHELGLWDIAGPYVVLTEAGARVTDLQGQALDLSVDSRTWKRSLRAVGANPQLHQQLIAIISSVAVGA
jgi:myo-inositol-1(or 4)-monophosphatase